MITTKQPLVSIIIPAHNVERYISECITSIISGYYQNIEIILIENGSKDKTGLICDQFASKDIRIQVYHTPGFGVSSARNLGIAKAHGEYLCFVDADDIVSKDYIEYLVGLITKNHVKIAVATKIAVFKELNAIPSETSVRKTSENIGSSDDALENILLYKMTVVSCFSKIFSKNFLQKNKIYFSEDLFIGEGFDFNVRAFSAVNHVAFSNKQIYFYRISNPNSAMTKVKIDRIQNGLQALKYLERTLTVRSDRIQHALKYAKWHTNFDFLMMIIASGQVKTHKKLFQHLIKETKRGIHVSLLLPISTKEKFKSLCASINPVVAAMLINFLRRRKIHG